MATRTSTTANDGNNTNPRTVELYRLNDFHETLQKSYSDAAKWYWTRYGSHPVKVTNVRTKDYRVISPKGQKGELEN